MKAPAWMTIELGEPATRPDGLGRVAARVSIDDAFLAAAVALVAYLLHMEDH